ncbi:MAG: hypothetical protein RSB77_00460 [Bacilli bacterium]
MLEKYCNDQKIAYKILSNAIKKDLISHAYIIETKKYEKSFDFALAFAADIFSQKKDIYNLLLENSYPDFRIVSTENLQYKKEDIINLQNEFKTKPICGKYKIYIIKECEKLNKVTSNAILKFLEEPEEGIIAILLVENRFQLMKTIISRCQIIDLKNDVRSEKTLEKIYKNLDGTESIENITAKIENLIKFILCIEKYKKCALLFENKYFLNQFKTKEQIYIATELLILFYKEIINYKNGLSIEYFIEYSDIIKKITEKTDNDVLLSKINVIIRNQKKLFFNVNNNLFLDKLIIELGGI